MNTDNRKSPGFRCKGCNTKFYPSMNRKSGKLEDLCWKCLGPAMNAARTDSIVFHPGVPGAWVNATHNNDQRYLDDFMQDRLGAGDSLYKQDAYHEYGEEAMGNSIADLFDSYEETAHE
jgi:hypothetical protein